MKLFVKRGEFSRFQKAKIEVDLGELTAIKMGLKRYEEWMKKEKWDEDEDPEIREIYDKVKEVLDGLENKNELEWK